MSLPSPPAAAPFDVLVLIAPAGQLEAISVVFTELPPTLAIPVLIAPSGEEREANSVLEELAHQSRLPIREAESGMVLEPGCVYTTPMHQVLEIRPGLRCTLAAKDDLPSPRPLDQLLASLALSAGPRALVVVLGGEGQDGVAGARTLRGVGSTVLVQRPEGAAGAELPRALTETANLVLSTNMLGQLVADLLGGGGGGPVHAPAERGANEERYRALFSEMDQAYAVVEVMADAAGHWTDFLFLEVNRAFMRHTGMPYPVGRTATQLLGTPNPRWAQLYGQAVDTGESMQLEEGELTLGRVFDLNIFRLGGEGSRQVAVLFTDITERKRREANQALLVELSRDLSQPFSEEELFHTVGAKLAAHLGLTCYHYVDVDEDRAEATVRHFWHALDLPSVLGTYPTAGFMSPEGLVSLRAGATSVIHDVQVDLSGDAAATVARKAGATAQQIGAYVAVPYSQDNRWKAYFAVADSQARRWTPLEIELIQEVASRLFPRIERLRTEQSLRMLESNYRTLFDTMSEGLMVCGVIRDDVGKMVDLRYLEFNRGLERQTGMDRQIMLGRRVSEVLPRADLERWLPIYSAVVEGGEPVTVEEYTELLDRWFAVSIYLRAADKVVSFYHDITERKRAEEALRASEERQSFLLQLSDVLQRLTEPNDIRTAAMHMLGTHLGVSRAQYHEVDDSGEYYSADGIGYADGLPLLDLKYPIGQFGSFVAEDFEAGRPFRSDDLLTDPRPTDEEREAYGFYGIRAGAGIPLLRGRRLVAILAVHDRHPHAWTDLEMELIRETAERVWVAVEKVRTELAVRESEQRQAFLLTLADALRPLTDPVEIQGEATRVLREYLAAGWCYYVEWDEAAARGVVLRDATRGGLPSLAGTHDVSDVPGFLDTLRMRNVLNVSDYARFDGLSPELRARYTALGFRSMLVATLVKQGRLVASLLVGDTEVRAWSSDAEALLTEVAERTWAAVERARAEEARRASEARFRAVANLVPDLLWESEPDGSTTWRNQRWLDYTGQTREQATGWGWTEAIHPDDREGSAQRYGQAAQMGQPLRQEHRIRRHNGEYRWFVVNTFPLRNERGEMVRVYGTATDIHHLRVKSTLLEARVEERTRQLAELNAELESRNQALEAFAELTRSLVPYLDPQVLIRRGQEVALSLLPKGFVTYYEPEGSRWRLRAQVGDMRNPALQAVAEAGLEMGEVPSLDQPWKSGSPLFQGHYAPDTDGLGSLDHSTNAVATLPLTVGNRQVGVFAVALFARRAWSGADRAVLETVVRNLGLALERAEAVRALSEEREALSTFAHFAERTAEIQDVPTLAQHATDTLQQVLSPDSAVYLEREGELWRLRHASGHLDPELEAALRQGVPADLPGYNLPFERREPVFFEHWDPGEHTPAPLVHLTAIAAYPLFPDDHPAGMLSMAVTDRPTWTEREKAVFRAVGDGFRLALERTAQLLQIERQRERLADLNAELGNLITRTAHTLEAPTQRMGLLLESGKPLDHLPLRDSETLQDEVTRLRSVAADLRQLARLEQQEVTRELLPLAELFGEVRGAVSATARGERLRWQIGPLPIVRGDRALLKQALEALMTFTLSETRSARTVTVESRDVQGEVHVTVEDDGIGLTGEEAATLFDLSVRTDQNVPVLAGSGLIQVRRILARHGGWVWAEAELSRGKIVLAFPRDEGVNELEALFREDNPGM